MTRLIWDKVGDRRFEAGVDRGVLYTTGGLGVPWNGLKSVKESPSGGDATPYYVDGEKYVNVPARVELGGSIDALTYPDEFGIHDGSYSFDTGLTVFQQRRLPFSMSYRTKYGNDVAGADYGYRIHIIYEMLAEPAEREYSSVSDSIEPLSFSWNFTTTPRKPVSDTNLAPLAHVVLDSTKTSANLMSFVEELLYGTASKPPTLISLNNLVKLFEHPQALLGISQNTTSGLNSLVSDPARGDLFGQLAEGLYAAPASTHLVPTAIPGLYTWSAS